VFVGRIQFQELQKPIFVCFKSRGVKVESNGKGGDSTKGGVSFPLVRGQAAIGVSIVNFERGGGGGSKRVPAKGKWCNFAKGDYAAVGGRRVRKRGLRERLKYLENLSKG